MFRIGGKPDEQRPLILEPSLTSAGVSSPLGTIASAACALPTSSARTQPLGLALVFVSQAGSRADATAFFTVANPPPSARIRCSATSPTDHQSGAGFHFHCSSVRPSIAARNSLRDSFSHRRVFARSSGSLARQQRGACHTLPGDRRIPGYKFRSPPPTAIFKRKPHRLIARRIRAFMAAGSRSDVNQLSYGDQKRADYGVHGLQQPPRSSGSGLQ